MKKLNILSYIFLLKTLLTYFTYGRKEPAMLKWENSNNTVLFYPDNNTDQDQYDLFYDRIVPITLFEVNPDGSLYKNIAIGIVLDDRRILTSFNPFREIIKNKKKMSQIKFTFISSRKWYKLKGERIHYYGTYTRTIGCARCVIPAEDTEILLEQWHGLDQKHSPLHDLLVLKTTMPIQLGEVGVQSIGYDIKNRMTNIEQTGPIVTKFAKADQHIGRELNFVSLGLTDYEPISVYQTLRYAMYDQSDLIDCNAWLPKNWGYFICLKNDPSFIGFASSAMLFSNEVLFGVGSFTIWRGTMSVLVFTDVRPYADLINNTCTEQDLSLLYRVNG